MVPQLSTPPPTNRLPRLTQSLPKIIIPSCHHILAHNSGRSHWLPTTDHAYIQDSRKVSSSPTILIPAADLLHSFRTCQHSSQSPLLIKKSCPQLQQKPPPLPEVILAPTVPGGTLLPNQRSHTDAPCRSKRQVWHENCR